jgi:hypothetical protein
VACECGVTPGIDKWGVDRREEGWVDFGKCHCKVPEVDVASWINNIAKGALLAGVGSSIFSWPAIDSAPWTAKALFYASLITALVSVGSGTQQYITLSRIRGERLERFQKEVTKNKTAQSHHLYIWQMPIMLLSFSIWYLLIGLLILICDRAAVSPAWDQDMKVNFKHVRSNTSVPLLT